MLCNKGDICSKNGILGHVSSQGPGDLGKLSLEGRLASSFNYWPT